MPPPTRPTTLGRPSRHRVVIYLGGRPVVALLPSSGHVRVGLVIPALERVVDVSVQPGAAALTLDQAGRQARIPSASVDAAARDALETAARSAGAWTPSAEVCLPRAFGGVAFPLLAAAYDEGAAPLREVPRWAEPVLAARTVADGASAAFGSRSTRTVRRALVDAIRPLPTGQVDLAVVAFALMARDVLQPDRLARVLACRRVPHPQRDLPDPATIRAARPLLADWGDVRTERVLTDAAARPDGMAMLLDTLHFARQLGVDAPSHLPTRLADLHDVHRALVRTQTAPTGRSACVPPAPAPQRDRAGRPPPHRALAPAVAAAPVGPDAPITPPPAVRALEGRGADDLVLVLPHAAGDVVRWGRLLSNCLGDFAPSAVAGRTVLVGVQRANRIAYVVELTTHGTIRQFCGRANRRPTEHDRCAVVSLLAATGALDPRAPDNRPWLEGIDLSAQRRP